MPLKFLIQDLDRAPAHLREHYAPYHDEETGVSGYALDVVDREVVPKQTLDAQRQANIANRKLFDRLQVERARLVAELRERIAAAESKSDLPAPRPPLSFDENQWIIEQRGSERRSP